MVVLKCDSYFGETVHIFVERKLQWCLRPDLKNGNLIIIETDWFKIHRSYGWECRLGTNE